METHVALLGPIGEKVVAKMNDRFRQRVKYIKQHSRKIIIRTDNRVYRYGTIGAVIEIKNGKR